MSQTEPLLCSRYTHASAGNQTRVSDVSGRNDNTPYDDFVVIKIHQDIT